MTHPFSHLTVASTLISVGEIEGSCVRIAWRNTGSHKLSWKEVYPFREQAINWHTRYTEQQSRPEIRIAADVDSPDTYTVFVDFHAVIRSLDDPFARAVYQIAMEEQHIPATYTFVVRSVGHFYPVTPYNGLPVHDVCDCPLNHYYTVGETLRGRPILRVSMCSHRAEFFSQLDEHFQQVVQERLPKLTADDPTFQSITHNPLWLYRPLLYQKSPSYDPDMVWYSVSAPVEDDQVLQSTKAFDRQYGHVPPLTSLILRVTRVWYVKHRNCFYVEKKWEPRAVNLTPHPQSVVDFKDWFPDDLDQFNE